MVSGEKRAVFCKEQYLVLRHRKNINPPFSLCDGSARSRILLQIYPVLL